MYPEYCGRQDPPYPIPICLTVKIIAGVNRIRRRSSTLIARAWRTIKAGVRFQCDVSDYDSPTIFLFFFLLLLLLLVPNLVVFIPGLIRDLSLEYLLGEVLTPMTGLLSLILSNGTLVPE